MSQFELVQAVLGVLILTLFLDLLELGVQLPERFFLLFEGLLQSFLFLFLLLFRVRDLKLKLQEILLVIHNSLLSIRRRLIFRFLLDLSMFLFGAQLVSLLLLLLDLLRENAAFVFQIDHVRVLDAHVPLVRAMTHLQRPEVLLGSSQLHGQIPDAFLVFTILVEFVQAHLLLLLDFREHLVFLLQVFQDLLLMLLLVLQCSYLLKIVTILELSLHLLDFLLIVVNPFVDLS